MRHEVIATLYSLAHDQLLHLVYEKVAVTEGKIEPHLWTYRNGVSLEHLGQTLQGKNLKVKHPVLHEFIEKVVFKCTFF